MAVLYLNSKTSFAWVCRSVPPVAANAPRGRLGALHGNAVAFIGNRLHTVSGKPEGGGLPDLGGKATAQHDVLELPAGGGTN